MVEWLTEKVFFFCKGVCRGCVRWGAAEGLDKEWRKRGSLAGRWVKRDQE